MFTKTSPSLAVLVDPDKQSLSNLQNLVQDAELYGADYIFIGGSLLSTNIDDAVLSIKEVCTLPVILFPGHYSHLSQHVDAVLLLSLISGRNPEFLIGNHVIAAPLIKKMGLQTISCGYMLIESGKTTSVEYMSNTKPIPANKEDIAVATAIAGELIGNASIYLEGGSGASNNINHSLIHKVSKNISIPLIVGGGIDSPQKMQTAFEAGADIVVIGTAIEQNPSLIKEFCTSKKQYNVLSNQ